jgi:glycosyltransferase involved in cell wall biosynthesis
MLQVAHFIHFPVSARSFVSPFVEYLNQEGISSELCLEYSTKYQKIIDLIDVPKQFISSDLEANPFSIASKVFACWRYFQRRRIVLLHSHQTRASLIPLLAAFLARIPVRIYHNHGLPYLGYQGLTRLFLWLLEYINTHLATHVLFVSQSNLEAAVADGLLPRNKAHILANGTAVGIDLRDYRLTDFNQFEKNRARDKFGISEDAFVLSYIGRPVKRKGLHFLLKSWQLTGLAHQGATLLIAGCTADECNQALGYPVAGVKALGYLTDLKPFYAASDALTLPSRHEGFPYSLLEAAAAGLPLIGTDIPGIRCAIKAEETGILVPFNDEVALANAIKRVANDPSLRNYLGQNARRRVENEFERSIVLEALLEFYRMHCPELFSNVPQEKQNQKFTNAQSY